MDLSAAPGDLSAALDALPTGERPRIDRGAGRLAGSRCTACGTVSWPSRAICHRCGSPAAAPHLLSDRGRLVTYTTVWVSRPPLQAPFTLGQIELPDGVLVFAHVRELEDGRTVPVDVELVPAPEADAVPPFWFIPSG